MRKGLGVIEDEVLTDRNRTLLLFHSPKFLSCRFSGGLRCFEESLCASGSTSVVFPLSRADDQASTSVRRLVRL